MIINNKEQDRFLPIANVGRIMKKVIPGNGKISKDAKETVQECVSEFISFVTGEASDKCQREKRKTINGDDILWAITTLGFEDYVNPLKIYLAKYRDIEGEKLNVPKQQQRGMQHDHNNPYNNNNNNNNNSNSNNNNNNHLYSSTNLISHQPFVTNDPPFPLPLPQHDHVDDHW
ncbi:nuclear factor Y [Perilla frutescens var. frutescens]|nr:nuclear factor Y [Perilla frutescens var. frutescens]